MCLTKEPRGEILGPHFRESTKGAQHPVGAVVRVVAVELNVLKRKREGEEGWRRDLGEGAQNLDLLAQLPLLRGAALLGRRFCAVGWILGIFYKNSVSHAGCIYAM